MQMYIFYVVTAKKCMAKLLVAGKCAAHFHANIVLAVKKCYKTESRNRVLWHVPADL